METEAWESLGQGFRAEHSSLRLLLVSSRPTSQRWRTVFLGMVDLSSTTSSLPLHTCVHTCISRHTYTHVIVIVLFSTYGHVLVIRCYKCEKGWACCSVASICLGFMRLWVLSWESLTILKREHLSLHSRACSCLSFQRLNCGRSLGLRCCYHSARL